MITKQSLLDKDLTLIPMSDIEITKAPEKTVAYDLTVNDYFTFATHDGLFVQDCMALYYPVNDVSVADVRDKMSVTRNLSTAANGQLVAEPSQDIVLGIHSCTTDESPERIDYKGTPLSPGLYRFNKAIDEYITITEPVDKKTLYLILNRLSKMVTPERMVEILNDIKDIGFEYSTNHGYTLGLDDIYSEELEEYNKTKLTGVYSEDMKNVYNTKELQSKLKNLNIASYIDSGARGSWDQARQLSFSRGYVADSSNNVRAEIIRPSLVSGLTQRDFFNSSWGTRKGLLDTALSTGDSGYVTRQLIYATSTTEIPSNEECINNPELDDCGSTKGLELELAVYDATGIMDMKKSKDLIRSLAGRYYLEGDSKDLNVIPDDEFELRALIGKSIILRSPIYCSNVSVCRKCYGDNYKRIHGTQVGIIAAQTVGERLTQLILRNFHTSLKGSTTYVDVNGKSYTMEELYMLVNGERKDIYGFSCSEDGKVEVSKILKVHRDHVTKKMINVTLDNGEVIQVTHGHEFMMRDGKYKVSEKLQPGDSMMPLYFAEPDPAGYRRVKQNTTNNGKIDIVKVEFVELDEPEAFYDLTVDSEYHNFALGSGIFVHNSGAASTKKSTKKSNSSGKKQNQDIITGMKVVKQLLHDPNSFVEDGTPKNLLMCMYNLFQKYGTNYMVHYEVIISCMMWADDDFWRLHEDRENVKTNYYSILKVPSMVSWLIGCAFSNVKTKLLDALTGYKVDHCSSLSKLFRL